MTSTENLATEWWTCACGNTPDSDGFYSCLEDGKIVPPYNDGPWDGFSYVCYRCNAIVLTQPDGSGRIVAQASAEACKYNDEYDWSDY